MIELLTSSPEVLVALLGLTTSAGLALRALPGVLDRVAKARETEAEAKRTEAEAARLSADAKKLAAEADITDAHTTRETVIALMQRAETAEAARTKAEEHARALSIELDRLRNSIATDRGYRGTDPRGKRTP